MNFFRRIFGVLTLQTPYQGTWRGSKIWEEACLRCLDSFYFPLDVAVVETDERICWKTWEEEGTGGNHACI